MSEQRPAGIYTRISSDPTNDMAGVLRQEASCRRLATQQGWLECRVYTDNDVSAFSGQPRPAYEQLLADIRSAAIGVVVAWDGDRLHRSARELEEFIALIEERGIDVVTVTGGRQDFGTATGRMQARIKGTIASYESDHKRERIRAAHLSLAEAGRFHGGKRPYGYDVNRDAAGNPLRDGTLHIVEHEAAIIREIVRRVLASESIYSICVDLNARGVTTSRGGLWRTETMRGLVLAPSIAGLRAYKGEVIAKAVWQPIVAEDEWQQICRLLEPRVSRPPAPATAGARRRTYVLSGGLITCLRCGRNLMSHVTGDGRRVYACLSGADHIGCGRMSITATPAEEAVIGTILAREAFPSDTVGALRPMDEQLDDAARTLASLFVDGELAGHAWQLCRAGITAGLAQQPPADTMQIDELAIDVFRSRPIDWQRQRLAEHITQVVIRPAVRRGRRFDPSRIVIHWVDGSVTRPIDPPFEPRRDTRLTGEAHDWEQLTLLPETRRLDDALVSTLYKAGMSIGDVAAELGFGRSSVRKALLRSGTLPRPVGRYRVDDTPIRNLFEAGVAKNQISRQMGISRQAVLDSLRRSGAANVDARPGPTKGLTEDDELAIAAAYSPGSVTMTQLARRLGISEGAVSGAVRSQAAATGATQTGS